jgi:hypothetical protein
MMWTRSDDDSIAKVQEEGFLRGVVGYTGGGRFVWGK